MYGIINTQQIFDTVEAVCQVLGNGKNNSAHKLILGTIAVESGFGWYKDQTPFKAGSGLCQFDKVAFDDIKRRTRIHNKERILEIFYIDIDRVTYEMLEYNPLLSVIFCRLFYKLISEEIPNDTIAMGVYWKRYYNTEMGKGTAEKFVEAYNHHIGGVI